MAGVGPFFQKMTILDSHNGIFFKIAGISKLLVAESGDFAGFLPERLAPVLLAAQDQFKFSHIIAGASAVSRF